jgi:hypothetical protein
MATNLLAWSWQLADYLSITQEEILELRGVEKHACAGSSSKLLSGAFFLARDAAGRLQLRHLQACIDAGKLRERAE